MAEEKYVRVSWGSYSFRKQSGTFSCVLITPPRRKVLAAGPDGLKKHGTLSSQPSGDHPDIAGRIMSAVLTAQEGAVLCARYSKNTNGARSADAEVFIRLRANGPKVTVMAKVPGDPDSVLPGRLEIFRGNGDTLTYQQIKALGFDIDSKYRSIYMDADELEECFEVASSGGTNAGIEIQSVSDGVGCSKTIVVDVPRRRVRIRR